jgi:hypothetical protein
MDKRSLTERDICTKFILPAVKRAGWDEMLQVREEVYFAKGRIIVRSKLVTRGKAKKADFVLYYKPNIPIALIEAKDNNHSIGHGIQQGLDYPPEQIMDYVVGDVGKVPTTEVKCTHVGAIDPLARSTAPITNFGLQMLVYVHHDPAARLHV